MKQNHIRKISQHPQKYEIHYRFLVFFVKQRFKIHLKTHCTAFEIPAKFEIAQHNWSKLKPRILFALCPTPPGQHLYLFPP